MISGIPVNSMIEELSELMNEISKEITIEGYKKSSIGDIMTKYNYFASPFHSPRARSFREAYGSATPGQGLFGLRINHMLDPQLKDLHLFKSQGQQLISIHSLGLHLDSMQDFHGPTPPGYNYGMQKSRSRCNRKTWKVWRIRIIN